MKCKDGSVLKSCDPDIHLWPRLNFMCLWHGFVESVEENTVPDMHNCVCVSANKKMILLWIVSKMGCEMVHR